MGVLRGLGAFGGTLEGGESTGTKKVYFNLKNKETAKVWLLDDLDEGTPAVEAGAGVAVLLKEHKSPKDFHRRAQCTKNDDGSGECWACEQAIANPKTGWGRSKRIYLNVLVDNGKDDPFVAIWSLAPSSPAWETILEEYIDNGSAAVGAWRVRASGVSTQKKMYAKLLDNEQVDFAKYKDDVFDLEAVTMTVPYAEQEAHYNKSFDNAETTTTTEPEEAETAEW